MRNLTHSVVGVCLLALSTTTRAWACGETSATITNVPMLGGSAFQINGLNSSGQITGFSYTQGNRAAHAFRYSNGVTVDLLTLGGNLSQGNAINSSGQVAGDADLSGGLTRATLWTGANGTDLGTLGGSFSTATALNDAGQVAGNSLAAGNSAMFAFLYTGGSMTSLGDLGGGSSEATAINQFGSVTGDSFDTNFEDHAFLYVGGAMNDLGTLGGNYSLGLALNDNNVVVGESANTNAETHAIAYANGVLIDLGTLGGSYSSAAAVNNAGQVVGVSTIANDTETHAFLFSNGSLTDLGTLGGSDSEALAINGVGQIVGDSSDTNGNYHAVLWQNGTMVDLDSLLPTNSGWQLSTAQFINDAGQIAGYGLYQGVSAVFLMTLSAGGIANPPVANAGQSQVVECPALVTLDGSGSTGSGTLAYQWTLGAAVLGTNPVLTVSLPLGTNLVTLTVTDPCNTTSQAQVVVVVRDTTPPTVSCPGALTAPAGMNCQAPVPNLVPLVTASDSCTPLGSLTVTQDPVASTLVGLGPHPVVVTVTDASGNSATCTTLFTVQDTTAPNITAIAANPNVLSPPNHQLVPVTVSVTASDTCDPSPMSKILSVASSQPLAAGDVQITGPFTVNLAATRSPSGADRVYTILVQCTDASGNSATATVNVTVTKNNGNGNGKKP